MDYVGGGDSGGGYNNNNFGGGGGGSSQDSIDKKRRSYDEQTLIPVTIGMASKAHMDASSGDGRLVLDDGRPLHSIKLIAAVRSVEDMSTNVVYQIEDGTGLIDVKQWLDDNDSSAIMEMRKETAKDVIYVKVIGQVKDYEGQKMIVANSVRRISTGNELTHHLLEVMYSAEMFKRADSIVTPQPMMVSSSSSFLGGFGNYGSVSASTGAGRASVDSNESKKNRLIAVMQQYDQGEEGVSVDLCVQMLPDLSKPEILKLIEMLSEEGSVYSTISESHFKAAA
jgi:replication factor A2